MRVLRDLVKNMFLISNDFTGGWDIVLVMGLFRCRFFLYKIFSRCAMDGLG